MTDTHAVLWDMDGVLVDTTDLHYSAWTHILKPYDIPWSREIFLTTFGWNNPAIIRTLFDHPSDDFIRRLDDAKETAFRAGIPGHIDLLPGVRAWLERFHAWGWPQAIVSSAPMANVDALIDETGIRQDFETLVSAWGMPSKPDPMVFLEGAKRLGVPPERCIVFEDSPAGVEGARRAGMKCIAVLTTHTADELPGATLIVPLLTDLSETDVQQLFA